jgi:hypothetical protein
MLVCSLHPFPKPEVTMSSRLVAMIVAGSAALVSAAAQTPDSSGRVTVTGCVERAQRNGSLAGTDVGTTASPNTAPSAANSGELLNRFLLTDAAPGEASARRERTAAQPPARYALEGHEQELGNYVAQRVQITGRLATPRSSGQGGTQHGLASGVDRIDVATVKSIARDCRGAKP